MMTTAVDDRPRQRGRLHRVAAVAIIVVTVVLAIVLYRAWTGGESSPDQLRAAISAQLTTALEQATPSEHEQHGHYDLGSTSKVLCAVELLGFEPADATGTQQVRKVYANHLCAVSDNGRPWDYAVKTSGSLAAAWDQPIKIQVVLQGAGYSDRVAEAIPQQYHEKAVAAVIDERTLARLRTRFDTSVADFWTIFKASKSSAG